ncbi:probable cytochrome P450 6a20 [Hermetia illucens]|uniref:probable cytochrome P450 6a20 n=1 Tax=Hermetia illucens TaxID=343691 RepID=UPI0018CC308D|nr:probable cytochrome P450 6a20 [Hermetia illucens]
MEFFTSVIWLTVILLGVVYFYFRRKYSYWKNRGVPYIEPTFPLGNLSRKNIGNLREVFEKVYNMREKCPFVGAYFVVKPVAIATDLDFIKDVLVKDFNNFHGRGIHINEKDSPLSAHLFALDGPKWRSLRMKLSPTFTSGKMKYMFPSIVGVSEQFNQTLGEILHDQSDIDVKEILSCFTTDVIGTCAFGVECNSLKDPNAVFREYGRKVLKPSKLRSIALVLARTSKLAATLRLSVFGKDITNFFIGIVRQTIEHREKNNVKRNDFMDLLIDLKNNDTLDEDKKIKLEKLTLEQVAAQAFVFFVAGFETSSTTMMFALYELALNQEIQDKLRTEINTVCAKHGGRLTYEAMNDMVYLGQVVNETLRKHPPVVVLQRVAQDDYKVANTKLVIEKGTTVMVPTYQIQHDERYYPNPEKFDPDRFLPEVCKSRHPMTFLSFGDGPRNCIGLRFGRLQSRVGLAMLLKNYRFEPSEKTPIPKKLLPRGGILASVDRLHLKIIKI